MESQENSSSEFKKLVEPSDNINKTKQKLQQQKNFLDPEKLNPKDKNEVLKSINDWIALHHGSREDIVSQNMGLFKNNEESARPSKAVKQIEQKIKQGFENNNSLEKNRSSTLL